MKILFVANRMPFPPYRGDKLKIFNLATELSSAHELHLITIAENDEDLRSVSSLKGLFKEIEFVYRPKWRCVIAAFWGIFSRRPIQVAYFRSNRFAKKLQQILADNTYDAIHVQHLRMGQYFETAPPSNAIIDLPDAFSMYWLRRRETASNLIERWIRNLEFMRLRNYEISLLPKFKKALVCSREDREYLNQNGVNNVAILPNGVNISLFSPRPDILPISKRVLFTGNMDYAPNIDAVRYFVKDILPEIIRVHPDVQFIIAGQRPVKAIQDLASTAIHVTGFVPDLALEYAKATLVVAPLRMGAGTQNKVLEALAMNIPVVCSSVGFDGLNMKEGEGILLGTNAVIFAKHVNELLQSEILRTELGSKGGKHVRASFAWQAVSAKLVAYFTEINQYE